MHLSRYFFIFYIQNAVGLFPRASDETKELASDPIIDQKGFVGAKPISKDIAALSIEFCYISDYLGDINEPNHLSLQLLQNVEDIIGSPPIIRIGGHTQDVAQYCSSCLETLNNTFAPGNDEAIAVSFNQNLFGVMNQNVPLHQRFIFGLNYGSNRVSIPRAEIEAAEKYIEPSRLITYELGNEPDFYNVQRPGTWNVQAYATQQEQWLRELSASTAKGFVLGSFAQEPRYMGNFSLKGITALELPKNVDFPVAYSDHTYPYSLCDPKRAALVSLPNLMNHTNTVQFFAQWAPEIDAAKVAGIPFFMGETGSVSCHGASNVSNTFGAALWQLDYMLHGATLNMKGIYFHMGTPFFYSMWQPIEWKGMRARVYPTYYSLLFMAVSLAIDEPHIAPYSMNTDPGLVIYGIYSRLPSLSTKPRKIIILNLKYLPANSTLTSQPSISIDVSKVYGNRAKVIRLSAASSDSISGATLAGQSFEHGNAQGTQEIEECYGVVVVRNSEAVIIEPY